MLWKIYSVLIQAGKLFSRKGIYPFLRQRLESIEPNAHVLSVGSSGPTAELVREYADSDRVPSVVSGYRPG